MKKGCKQGQDADGADFFFFFFAILKVIMQCQRVIKKRCKAEVHLEIID